MRPHNHLTKVAILFLLFIGYSKHASAQSYTDSLYISGTYRVYIIHLPNGYSSVKKYPLVLNFHGLNETAAQQESYTNMDATADTSGFIVVYPQGIGNTWNLSGATSSPNDSVFVSQLLYYIAANYSINTCRVYATGISLGGFMCYNLACQFADRFSAIAVVSGNMADVSKLACKPHNHIPLMHIHGTADYIVSYSGTFGISSVPNTVLWWAQTNGCNLTPAIGSLPNTNLGDSTTADIIYYIPGPDSAETFLVRINNGGHTWPGAVPTFVLGNTCEDFNANVAIWNFFKKHLSCVSGINTTELTENVIQLFPNPSKEELSIIIPDGLPAKAISIYNISGEKIKAIQPDQNLNARKISLNISSLPAGTYFLRIENEKSFIVKKFTKIVQ